MTLLAAGCVDAFALSLEAFARQRGRLNVRRDGHLGCQFRRGRRLTFLLRFNMVQGAQLVSTVLGIVLLALYVYPIFYADAHNQ